MEEYLKWKNNKKLASELKDELELLSKSEIESAFSGNLQFGTGGIRGIMGVGSNRMNVHTLSRVNYGYGKFLLRYFKNPIVCIAYDNRHNSKEFAELSARVLGTLKIKSFLFKEITPTPVLSFAIRHLQANGGIVITASHNPPSYNGYKAYDSDGCQLVPKLAAEVFEFSNQLSDIFSLEIKELEELEKEGIVEYIDDSLLDGYLQKLKTISLNPSLDKSDFKIVFTPLHGTTGKLGKRLLVELGYDVICVEEQMVPDPDFGTVKSPNPESRKVFDLALEYAKKHNADICLATDPDGDRIGITYLDDFGQYSFLTGNQLGALIVYYLVNQRKDLDNLVMFKTIVTSNLGSAIAKSKGIEVKSTLTGFRFIGEQIKLLENSNKKLFFAYEESFGFLISDFVRDKDSLQAMLIIAEMVNYYKKNKQVLTNVLEEIYQVYGYYLDDVLSFTFLGKNGQKTIEKIMNYFRNNRSLVFARTKCLKSEDFFTQISYNKRTEKIDLPKANVIKYYLEADSWFALRPSGTEPKLKVYISVKDKQKEKALQKFENLRREIESIVNEVD